MTTLFWFIHKTLPSIRIFIWHCLFLKLGNLWKKVLPWIAMYLALEVLVTFLKWIDPFRMWNKNAIYFILVNNTQVMGQFEHWWAVKWIFGPSQLGLLHQSSLCLLCSWSVSDRGEVGKQSNGNIAWRTTGVFACALGHSYYIIEDISHGPQCKFGLIVNNHLICIFYSKKWRNVNCLLL